MKNEIYFVLWEYEDGNSSVKTCTKEELQTELAARCLANVTFHDSLPEKYTDFTDGDDVFIIKGEFIIPRLIKDTRKYELP